ncbi:MAG: hypothetical protein AB9Q22_06530 [Candidatus Reddybacter sp.]
MRDVETFLETIKIGRLICGGHRPLAIVEKTSTPTKTFQLQTVQNRDWNDSVADMTSGNIAATFILSPLAMTLSMTAFPVKSFSCPSAMSTGLFFPARLNQLLS